MKGEIRVSDESVDDRQSWFVESLVRALGTDDAIDVCRQNSWAGVLAAILERQSSPSR